MSPGDSLMRGPPPTVFARPLAAGVPLFRQVYGGLRAAILNGQPAPGGRLPATRALAGELGVSRNTVVGAYEQLLAEGYLEGRVGSGTYVARTLPEEALHAPPARSGPVPARAARPLSRRGANLARARILGPRGEFARPLRPGTPALDAFPYDLWDALARKRWRRRDPALLGYGDPAGYRPLREAIAAHVATARAVRCTADQVIIVSGAVQGAELVARVLLDPGDRAWVEDPGFIAGRVAFEAAQVVPVPVPIDAEGIDVVVGRKRAPKARLAYVTPSHQYPLGVTMTLARRLALLEWASAADAWIVEDDYDSEFRYEGRPLAALQGLDPHGRVVYLGTLSKTLFPSLRLAYLIVPRGLSEAFSLARATLDLYASVGMQAVAADFMVEGHFARHVRRMRTLYAERQAALVSAVQRELGERLEVRPNPTGLHSIGWLPGGVSDVEVSRRALDAGVLVPPLASYRIELGGPAGLMLGYAGYTPRQIRQAVRTLAGVL